MEGIEMIDEPDVPKYLDSWKGIDGTMLYLTPELEIVSLSKDGEEQIGVIMDHSIENRIWALYRIPQFAAEVRKSIAQACAILVNRARKCTVKTVSDMCLTYQQQQQTPDIGRIIAVIDKCHETISLIQQGFLLSERKMLVDAIKRRVALTSK
jgi:hypothetical protein